MHLVFQKHIVKALFLVSIVGVFFLNIPSSFPSDNDKALPVQCKETLSPSTLPTLESQEHPKSDTPVPAEAVKKESQKKSKSAITITNGSTGPRVEGGILKFTTTEQEQPFLRPEEERSGDFREVYQLNNPEKTAEQASRCSGCGTPFCHVYCPLNNNIPDWLLLATQGRLDEAYELSAYTNTFPEICGRICPKDTLCEGNCVIEQSGHGAVTIGAVETYLTETAFERGWVQEIRPRRERNQSVGIIGSGPAALAAAHRLRQLGYEVFIYERNDRLGGLLVYGIPNFKLDKKIVERRLAWIERSGRVHWIRLTEVGGKEGPSFQNLWDKHDAILIATGVYRPNTLEWQDQARPPENLVQALEYLTASNRKGLGDVVPGFENGRLNAKNKRVAVIGGGDTAMDCVRTAIRQDAREVTCLYRRQREDRAGSQTEVKLAEREGVKFFWMSTPVGMPEIGTLLYLRTKLNYTAEQPKTESRTGRRAYDPIPGSESTLRADLVIQALGFRPESSPHLFNEPGLELTRWDTLKIKNWKTMETSADKVFGAGDIARGGSLVVWAIRDGRAAANGIHEYLLSL